MTLKERLEKTDNADIIYLGGSEGYSFIFIGKAKDLKQRITVIEHEYYEKLIQSTMDAAWSLDQAKTYTPNTVENSRKSFDKCCKALSDWVPIQLREIKEEYPHTIDVPGTTILVKGSLPGPYWTYDEANKKK